VTEKNIRNHTIKEMLDEIYKRMYGKDKYYIDLAKVCEKYYVDLVDRKDVDDKPIVTAALNFVLGEEFVKHIKFLKKESEKK
jgi:hypothetical protein